MNDEQRLQLLKHAVGFKIDPPTIVADKISLTCFVELKVPEI